MPDKAFLLCESDDGTMNAEEKRLEDRGSAKSIEALGTLPLRASVGKSAKTTALRRAWEFFPHDHARSRAYRWGEDGIMGISDRHQLACFALAL